MWGCRSRCRRRTGHVRRQSVSYHGHDHSRLAKIRLSSLGPDRGQPPIPAPALPVGHFSPGSCHRRDRSADANLSNNALWQRLRHSIPAGHQVLLQP